MNIFQFIDTRRLAGMNSVLGIDFSERGARVVELKRTGNYLQKNRLSFRVANHFEIPFGDGSREELRAQTLKDELKAHGVGSKYVVTSLKTGIKTIQAVLPLGIEKIDDWIAENYEKLVRLPLPLSDVMFQYEVFSNSDSESIIEMTFARKSDIHKLKDLIRQAGLDLVSLSAGVRDIVTVLVTASPEVAQGKVELHCYGENENTIFFVDNTRRTLSDMNGVGRRKVLTGIVSENDDGQTVVLKPLGLPSAFALAVGLAIKGFVPDTYGVDFRDEINRTQTETSLSRSLFHRAVIAVGVILLFLMMVPMAVSLWTQSQIDRMDEKLLSNGTQYTEVRALENQVTALENQMLGKSGGLSRSDVSRVVYRLASLTPEKVWLYRLSLGGDKEADNKIQLSGFAESNESVTQYLRQLERSDLFQKIGLKRSGVPHAIEHATGVTNLVRSPVLFEMIGVIRK